MHRNLRGLALRGALGGLMVAAGMIGAPALAAGAHAHGHGHETGHSMDSHTTNAHAKLDATPNGNASLSWDKTNGLTVTLKLAGLTPNAGYTANLEQGTCKNATAATLVDKFADFTADGTGMGQTSLTDSKVTGGIPHHGWFVAVNQGSTMVACGAVKGAKGDKGDKGHLGRHGHQVVTQPVVEKASAKLDATNKVGGEAHLQLKGEMLTVDLHAHGLTAGHSYPAEIGHGSCSMLGSAWLSLNSLTQKAHGDWSSTTTQSLAGINTTGSWYIAVWSPDHSTLLACGNVRG